MAKRRMFATDIVESDSFLEMPHSAQALYFHLCMNADDDGFVNAARKIVVFVDCSPEDLQLLIENGLVIAFNSGVMVIRDWKISNSIRSDRKKATIYQREYDQLTETESGAYTLKSNPQSDATPSPEGCQMVDTVASNGCQTVADVTPQSSQVNQDRLSQIDQVKPSQSPAPVNRVDVIQLLSGMGIKGGSENISRTMELIQEYGMESVKGALWEVRGDKNIRYPVNYATQILRKRKAANTTTPPARNVRRDYEQRTYTKEEDDALFTNMFPEDSPSAPAEPC